MRSADIPFRFDVTELLGKARKFASSRVGDVTLNLPFVSIAVAPKDREKQVAREIFIRLKDRRVLSSRECCDECIDRALSSLQEIRRFLVDKDVDLSDIRDSSLCLLIDAMTLGIRQFLTFEERLQTAELSRSTQRRDSSRYRGDARQSYFDALELLRDHLSRCLGQIALVAGMDTPADGLLAQYQGPWLLRSYEDKTAAKAKKP